MHPEKPMYTATPSLRFPQHCLTNGSKVYLIDQGPFLFFQGTLLSTSSFYTSLFQVIDGVVSLALCWQLASQTLEHFRSCKTPATCDNFPSLQHIQCSASTGVFEGGCLTLTAWASCSTFHYLAPVSQVRISSWNFRS